MSTEIVVFVYIILCICMLVYNLGYMGYKKADKRMSSKMVLRWKKRILDNKGVQVEFLNKKLLYLRNLFIFDDAISAIMKNDEKNAFLYLNTNKESFLYLAKIYEKKDSMKKAYYAYMMSKFNFLDNDFETKIAKVLINYTIDPSIYCRENALKALYSKNNIQTIVEAYRLMNKNKIHHNSKLVVDGLLSFKGDKIALAYALWEYRNEFGVEYHISFIDFARMITADFCKKFYDFLLEDNTDYEIKYALLRYFRKYRYEPVKEYLYNCINFQEGISWELVALAASALDNYPCNKTKEILKSALTANNWYVRYNAADSLLNLGITYLELQNIYNGNDRYAREMIEFKIQEKNIRA